MMFSPASTLRPLARQIQVKTSPPPRTLAERRLILAALQKYGEVVTFRHLNDPLTEHTSLTTHGVSLAIFETAESASKAIEASPLAIPVPPTGVSSSTHSRHHHPHHHRRNQQTEQTDAAAINHDRQISSTLTCAIEPSTHDHEALVKGNPYHGPFNVDTESSAIFRDLIDSGVPHAALADCESPRTKRRPQQFHVLKARAQNERMGATSLMALYRKGLRDAGLPEGEATSATTATETSRTEENHRRRADREDNNNQMRWKRSIRHVTG